MKTQSELLAMAAAARVEELKAKDQGRISGEDTTGAREFAAGVEAGILWALGHIGEIPFHTVQHAEPTPYDDAAEGASLEWLLANARPTTD